MENDEKDGKMNAIDSEKFKIDLDSENGESPTGDIPPDHVIEEIGRPRLPGMALFIAFIILFGLILFVFLNLSTRINAITRAGENRIKTVSSGVESKIESVSKQMDILKKSMNKKIELLESNRKKYKKNIGDLSAKVEKLSKSIKKLGGTHDKLRKKVALLGNLLEKTKDENKKSFAGIDARIKQTESEIKNLTAAQADALSEIADRLNTVSKQIDTLSASSIDRKEMKKAVNEAVDAMNKSIAFQLDRIDARYADRISVLQSKIDRLEQSVSSASPKKQSSTETFRKKSGQDQSPKKPVSGSIIEQEIQ